MPVRVFNTEMAVCIEHLYLELLALSFWRTEIMKAVNGKLFRIRFHKATQYCQFTIGLFTIYYFILLTYYPQDQQVLLDFNRLTIQPFTIYYLPSATSK